jgi:hypothetical protein
MTARVGGFESPSWLESPLSLAGIDKEKNMICQGNMELSMMVGGGRNWVQFVLDWH